MAKLPSARIVEAGSDTDTVTDAKGRKISIRKLDALDKMTLFGLVGSDQARNEAYMTYAFMSYCVTEIDGTPFATPGGMPALRAMVSRLGDAGIEAITPAFIKLMQGAEPDKVVEDAKNS